VSQPNGYVMTLLTL